uniref:WASH-7_mid domain-containing protein n=1 Tax=Macrostomum lignano TaxID=282301 RepID=A0A1I8FC38_9PLAT
ALSAVADHRRSWLADRDSSMTRDAQALLSLVQSWSARMEGSFRRADSVAGDLNVKASLLLEGLSLAFRLRHLVTTVLTLHSRTQTRVTKPCLLAMFRMIELLKVIQSVYQRRTVFLASNFSNVQQHFSYAAHQALHAAKNRPVLQIHLADLYTGGQDVNRVHYLFAALADASRFLLGARHAASPSGVVEAFESNIHAHLQLDDRNPLRVGRRDLVHLLTCRPIPLHDWRTYAEMKSLAQQQYRLYLVEPHLPSQQLEQGLDVLEIMRNINVFVAKYLYNLNNQIFVEKASNNKHLNTINIRHVANSIRTHGTGIMNTTFMFDEHIKARLIKDRRHFLENHVEGGAQGPDVPIGNAMGLRPHDPQWRTQLLQQPLSDLCPDLEDIPAFEELASKLDEPGHCDCAQQLDQGLTSARIFFAAEKEGGGGGGSGGSGGAGDSAACGPDISGVSGSDDDCGFFLERRDILESGTNLIALLQQLNPPLRDHCGRSPWRCRSAWMSSRKWSRN